MDDDSQMGKQLNMMTKEIPQQLVKQTLRLEN